MPKIYGYCRISKKNMDIERQVRNIKNSFKDAIIIKEIFTGTKMDRKEWNKLLSVINSGDTIVFDSVSRMSRNSDEGYKTYEMLYKKGINLIFLKEGHINTETYKKALISIPLTGTSLDCILDGINNYLLELAKEQIRIAFEQSEKEVLDLRQRTKEGIETARLNGKQIGQKKGIKLITKKSIKAKEDIIKYSKYFNGNLNDNEVIRLINISRKTYYKYKRELFFEK